MVVIGGQAERTRLDPHVDVFGHQHHLTRRVLFAQRFNHAENLVVCLALRQADGQRVIEYLGLEKQAAAGFAVACRVQFQPFGNVGAGRASQRVQRAAGLAGIACNLGHAFLVAV